MSELDRILKLAGSQAKVEETPSPAPEATQREMKPVAQEAVGPSAEPFYEMQDMYAGGECPSKPHETIIDELVRFMSGDQIEDFVETFRRHHMDMGDEMFKDDVDLDEDDLDENAFNQAAAAAARAGKEEFEFGGKKYKTKMDKSTAHKLDDDVQVESEETEETEETLEAVDVDTEEKTLEEAKCDCDCGESPCKECGEDHHDVKEAEEISEAPTMDTTQLVVMLKNAGLSEEAIEKKLNEWANTPEGAASEGTEEHGEPYEFAQSVNLSLKRYLDAEDMKVGLKEHKVEDIKAAYKAKKEQ